MDDRTLHSTFSFRNAKVNLIGFDGSVLCTSVHPLTIESGLSITNDNDTVKSAAVASKYNMV